MSRLGPRGRRPVADAASRSSTPDNSASIDDAMSFDDSIEIDELDQTTGLFEEPINLNAAHSFKNPAYKPPKKPRGLKQIVTAEKGTPHPVNAVRYWTIDATPSLMPQKKYCDLTGLEAKYTDPKTGLRYHSADCYLYVRKLTPAQVQQHLALRNASTQIR
ncbi:hypothetical protein DFJ74DRAFT_696677 [Hyaloraphidium curvatum]|nr:hypothetical protein DFJ74DRAFT_696677 [Hyaloraphidium curvatum]